jgi:hypothetical protein
VGELGAAHVRSARVDLELLAIACRAGYRPVLLASVPSARVPAGGVVAQDVRQRALAAFASRPVSRRCKADVVFLY